MTSKERVLATEPTARGLRLSLGWIIQDENQRSLSEPLAFFETEAEAWDDAASRLPQPTAPEMQHEATGEVGGSNQFSPVTDLDPRDGFNVLIRIHSDDAPKTLSHPEAVRMLIGEALDRHGIEEEIDYTLEITRTATFKKQPIPPVTREAEAKLYEIARILDEPIDSAVRLARISEVISPTPQAAAPAATCKHTRTMSVEHEGMSDMRYCLNCEKTLSGREIARAVAPAAVPETAKE